LIAYNGPMSEGRKTYLAVGDTVRIIRGTFKDDVGCVDSVDGANFRATVMIVVYGRITPVEVDFSELQRIGLPLS
jgi:transcription termination/antitermination protein NusG